MSNLKKATLLASGLAGLLSFAMIAIVVFYALAHGKPIDFGWDWPLLIPLILSLAAFLWGRFGLDE